MIGLGFKCDRIVVESVENGVKVSCVMISVGDYEMWDGNVMGVGNEMNGVEIVSDVVYERVFDGVEIMKKGDVYGMYGWLMGMEVMICKIEWEFINSGGVVFGSKGLMDRGVFDYKV